MRRSEIKRIIKQRNLAMVGVTYLDLAGVARMKPTVSSEIDSILDKGIKTARANYSLTTLELQTPHSAADVSQGDLAIVPDPDTFVVPSFTPEVGRFIGNLHEKDGSTSPLCTRSIYARVLDLARSRSYRFRVGFESEFHIVKREGEKLVPADLSPVHSQNGYNLHHLLIADIIAALRSVNVSPLKAHIEGGRAQMEVDVAHAEGLKPADDVVYFKDAVRTVTRRHGYLASFMPKIGHEWWGSGLHLHMSLWDSRGNNLFRDSSDKKGLGLSRVAKHFIGGLLTHLRALSAVAAPTVNSYKRILPGRWNADAVMYGPGARGAAVRIPDERGKATRIECRFPDGSCNPYLAMACILAAGLDGIELELDPGEPTTFDTSFMTDGEIRGRGLRLMPRSLGEALAEFENDALFRETLGEAVFEEYIRNKSFDIAQAADKVTQWEVDHYLDYF